MEDDKPLLATLVSLTLLVAGCVQQPVEPGNESPTNGEDTPVPDDSILDLDRILDNQTDPVGNLTVVSLSTREGQQITTHPAQAPWYAGPNHVVHESFRNGTRHIGLTSIDSRLPRTQLYNGTFSSSGAAESPSFAPSTDLVYFTHASARSQPKLIQRALSMGAEETVLATLRSQDIPQSPWAISPNGSLLAAGVWVGAADGPQSWIMVRNASDGQLRHVPNGSFFGNNPRFISNSSIVYDRGDLIRADVETGEKTRVVKADDEEIFSFPAIAGGWIWFTAQVTDSEADTSVEEIRRVPLDGGTTETVARSDAYQLGRIDVTPNGQRIVLEVHLHR